MTTIGLELTFLPRKRGSRWQEYRCQQEAKRAAEALNAAFRRCSSIKRLSQFRDTCVFRAKADTFRSPLVTFAQPHLAWCIEVNNDPLPASTIVSGPLATRVFDDLYKLAAAQGLFPHIEVHKRDGTVLDHPTGGGHIHVGISGLFASSSHHLLYLLMLEQALCLDYANLPLIRWMFAQWFDNTNSHVAVNRDTCVAAAREQRRKRIKQDHMASWAYQQALDCSSLMQRFVHGYKRQYPTWEMRWFDMPRTPDELRLQVGFVEAWVTKRVQQIESTQVMVNTKARKQALNTWQREVLSYRLTPSLWDRLTKDEPFARAEMVRFLAQLDLDPEPTLAAFWERGYKRRLRHGTFA